MFATRWHLRDLVLDILFPRRCAGCRAFDTWLCGRCAQAIEYVRTPRCPVCNSLSWAGRTCRRCRSATPLSGLVVVAAYRDSTVRRMIFDLKFRFASDIGPTLGAFMVNFLSRTLPPFLVERDPRPTVVPVPLHTSRLRERGFNQAELIARPVADAFDLPTQPTPLRRRLKRPPQVTLDKSDRLSNMRGVFAVDPRCLPLPKRVILVDDVATTLATLSEAARTLKAAGVKEVWGLVLARS